MSVMMVTLIIKVVLPLWRKWSLNSLSNWMPIVQLMNGLKIILRKTGRHFKFISGVHISMDVTDLGLYNGSTKINAVETVLSYW